MKTVSTTSAAMPAVASSIAVAIALCLGCTSVTTVDRYSGGPLPRPDRILVYEFAYSPSQVKLDRGIAPDIERSLRGTPRTFQELQTGAKVASVVADRLVKELRDMGLPAERANGEAQPWGNTYSVEGQFLSIDEGNRTERVVIGLGAGRSDVKVDVQLYQDSQNGQRVLEALDVSAKSGRKPGMAETMGAGGAMGQLAVSAAVGVGGAVGSEAFGANVDADGARAAKAIAKKLRAFFTQQGWIQTS